MLEAAASNGRRRLEGSTLLTALRRELWVLKQLDWNMRIVTPFEPLSLLSVILDLADGEVPGEPSIVLRCGVRDAASWPIVPSRALVGAPLARSTAYRTNGFGFRAALAAPILCRRSACSAALGLQQQPCGARCYQLILCALFCYTQMTQSSALDFRPLVVASAALLAAWAHAGDVAAGERHLRTLVEVSGAQDEDELLRCKMLLSTGFNQKTCHRDEMHLVSHLHLLHTVPLPEPWELEMRRAQVAQDTPFSAGGSLSPAY